MTDTEHPTTEANRRASTPQEIDIAAVSDVVESVVANVETVMVGHHDAIEHIMTALLGRGHVLLEDVPGVGKTMLARAVAESFDCSFNRVQFTPDLLQIGRAHV